MKFSLFYNFDLLPGTDIPQLIRNVEAQALAADALGYDGVWLAEHHFQEYGRMPSPLTLLARLSGLTTRLRLGTAVIEAPYYHPLRLAEDVALIDLLSNGRLQLGIGSGAANKPLEFERFGVRVEDKAARALEVTEILRQAFVDGRIDFEGTYYQHHDIVIDPGPVQDAQNLLYLAASASTIPFAVQHGLPILLPRPVPEQKLRDIVATYRGGLPSGINGHVASLRFMFVAETECLAHERTRATFQRYAKYDAGVDWDGRTEGAAYEAIREKVKFVAGTADQVCRQLDAWLDDLRPDEVMAQMFAAGTQHEDSLRSMELFAENVMPKFV